MVVCKFFLQGTCKFGNSCKFEHQINDSTNTTSILRQNPTATGNVPDVNALVRSVQTDMLNTEKGGQWLLSSYAPFKEKPAFPGFEDKSFEEIRIGFYDATKNGTGEQYKQQLQGFLQEAIIKIRTLQSPSQEIVNLLKQIYNTPLNSASSFVGTQPQPQPSAFGNSNAFSKPAGNSVFNTQANPNFVGQTIFSNQTANPTASPFTAQPTTNSPFNQQLATNPPFNQQPVTNPAFNQQPVTNPSFNQQPVANPPFNQQPVTNPAFNQQPPTNTPFIQQPTNSPFNQQPATNSPFIQQPTTNSPFSQQSTTTAFNPQTAAPSPFIAQATTNSPFTLVQQPQQQSAFVNQPNAFVNKPETASPFVSSTTPFTAQSTFSHFSEQNPSPFAAHNPTPFSNQTPAQVQTPFSAVMPNQAVMQNPSPFAISQSNSPFANIGQQNSTQSNSIFGSNQTTAVNVFGGQAVPNAPVNSLFYSKESDLTKEELQAFQSASFQMGCIPDKPPPRELCF